MNNDSYTSEKLYEYRQAEWDRLDRRGAFVKPDQTDGIHETQHVSRNVRLLGKLYGFFRKRRSRRSKSL